MDHEMVGIGRLDLGDEQLRTVRIGGTEYVTVHEVSAYLQSFSARLQELIGRQQDQLEVVYTSLEVLVDVLSANHPELVRELLSMARLRTQPV